MLGSREIITFALTALTWNSASAEVRSLTVPSRVIPVPASVSPEMQKILEMAPIEWPKPPKELEEWRELARQLLKSSESEKASREAMRRRSKVTIAPQVIGRVPCYVLTPQVISPRNRERLVLHLHKGGFFRVEGESGTDEAVIMAGATGIRTIAIDYRGLPDEPFPAGMDDVMAVWKAVIQQLDPRNIAVSGSSAGGGMTFSLVQRAKREGLPLPGAIMSGTPWADLSKTGDTWYTNEGVDSMLNTYDGFFEAVAKLYANGRSLKDPLISPLYGDFSGFPPTYLVSGTRDLYLSDVVRVHHYLLEAQVPTQLEVLEGQFHGAYLMGSAVDAPESAQLYAHIARFFDTHLGYQ